MSIPHTHIITVLIFLYMIPTPRKFFNVKKKINKYTKNTEQTGEVYKCVQNKIAFYTSNLTTATSEINKKKIVSLLNNKGNECAAKERDEHLVSKKIQFSKNWSMYQAASNGHDWQKFPQLQDMVSQNTCTDFL